MACTCAPKKQSTAEKECKNGDFLPLPKGFATIVNHCAQEPERWKCLALAHPIIMSATFKQPRPGEKTGYEYSRFNNPTRETLETVLKTIHKAKYATCYGSGMGAIATMLGTLKGGDHIICPEDVYGGTYHLFADIAKPMGMSVTWVDCTNTAEFAKAVKPATRLIWIESPSNPILKLVDIQEVAKIAKKNNILLVVDNTFASPFLQNPLELGADVIAYSVTKYLNGHSDVIMGALITNDDALGARLPFLQMNMGAVPSPFDCYQVLRGLKTFPHRMRQHMASSLAVAKFLESHPNIEKVMHPGLPSHPQYELAKKQMCGHSGMVSFYLKGGVKETKKFLRSLRIFAVGVSLGGFESLVQAPYIMSHAAVPEEQKKRQGIKEGLVRSSIGLEDVEDLIADLKQALEKMGGNGCSNNNNNRSSGKPNACSCTRPRSPR